ncbi:MAG TPA: DUF1223 domain-containing protein [Stellaceae bacterium]|nr:DUF1223 domain-containing protein [Stellaceae bacterium]
MTGLHKVSLTCVLLGSLVLISSPASAEARPVVVELFTSQGCSSCPPADALLGELERRDDVIAFGFHISYWDRLAWKDPFSSQSSTDRQRAYARLFELGQVYTPQMVVDGAREMVGSDRAGVLAALHDARPETVAAVTFAADRRSVTIGAGDGRGSVLLVRFALERTTRVAGGENARRTLQDANAVESLVSLGSWDRSPLRFAIEPPAAGEGIAVLVQAADGRMLGAAALQLKKGQP